MRAVNEDSHCAKVISDNCAFAVVADGMGGHRGGRTASSSAVDIISEYISARLTAGSDADSVKTILSDAIKTANELLIALANNNGGKDNITVVNMDFNEVTK